MKALLIGGPKDGERLEVGAGQEVLSVPVLLRTPEGAETQAVHQYRRIPPLGLSQVAVFVHQTLGRVEAVQRLLEQYQPTQHVGALSICRRLVESWNGTGSLTAIVADAARLLGEEIV